MTSQTGYTVRKTIVIARPRDETFRVFTEELGSWWPIETHSIYEDTAGVAVFETREGGRLYERTSDGVEADWGFVTAWDPPHGFTVSWKPNLDPGAPRTEFTVRFAPIDESSTRLDLEHTGWEAFGDEAAAVRGGYETGWDVVLGRFADAF